MDPLYIFGTSQLGTFGSFMEVGTLDLTSVSTFFSEFGVMLDGGLGSLLFSSLM